MNALHPRIRAVWVLRALLVAAAVGVAGALLTRAVRTNVSTPLPAWTDAALLALVAAVAVLGVVHALLQYRVWRFAVEADALSLERGVVTRVETAVPFVRVQHIDTRRGPLERLVGLSSVVVYTAGSRGADVTVPGLAPERARNLADRLHDLAVESEPEDAV